jgi:hypothetical protein
MVKIEQALGFLGEGKNLDKILGIFEKILEDLPEVELLGKDERKIAQILEDQNPVGIQDFDRDGGFDGEPVSPDRPDLETPVYSKPEMKTIQTALQNILSGKYSRRDLKILEKTLNELPEDMYAPSVMDKISLALQNIIKNKASPKELTFIKGVVGNLPVNAAVSNEQHQFPDSVLSEDQMKQAQAQISQALKSLALKPMAKGNKSSDMKNLLGLLLEIPGMEDPKKQQRYVLNALNNLRGIRNKDELMSEIVKAIEANNPSPARKNTNHNASLGDDDPDSLFNISQT